MTESHSELLRDSSVSDSRNQQIFADILQDQLSDYQQSRSSKDSSHGAVPEFLDLNNCPELEDATTIPEDERTNTVPENASQRIKKPEDAPACVPGDSTYRMIHAPDELREIWTSGGMTISRSLVRDESGAIEANLLTSQGDAFHGITIERSGAITEYGFLPGTNDPVYRTTIHPDGRVISINRNNETPAARAVRINNNNESEERIIDPSVAQERIAAIRSRVYGTRRSH